jgi:hypothetical protein
VLFNFHSIHEDSWQADELDMPGSGFRFKIPELVAMLFYYCNKPGLPHHAILRPLAISFITALKRPLGAYDYL